MIAANIVQVALCNTSPALPISWEVSTQKRELSTMVACGFNKPELPITGNRAPSSVELVAGNSWTEPTTLFHPESTRMSVGWGGRRRHRSRDRCGP